MAKEKYLLLYRNNKHINTVKFEWHNPAHGWQPTHFDQSGYLPFCLFDSLKTIKQKLITENINYSWSNTPLSSK